ncbi:thiamine phosphate synthase [Ketogulonicigenium vulgare]|uniref:Thiamine-phosphate pyrophosphorylase, putative n=1 Tax=Ketogulonicigenium vulgare (strain WSH-001) TaxID=759362 RepID=F9Y6Y9_KETVW|nr:thiamine phosphate synthase [Ketogulonicigenium vulgare]ADO42821.1 thiamine-phosphate pyrophosphorylase, putative [Ketogulonicigenium vulgare Y25]AEM41006.1 Thiamine-phosphate pyrophosphorylase, putative [Ketogulonicigenium vulgare WSH-001]ALJ81157.1 thiamine-phosphate pyrophosphorylase [Ketogulonicigenium vulgare]ANW33905.1 thiamine phosphate synthase [Ketogulonicigenium vulgare]AOZ54733.1 thiamine-phosphate pyrophosphorylase [Ketogulonicigenium vulgare]
MTDTTTAADDLPQIYLISPPTFDLDVFPDLMARCLDAVETSCVRLSLATRDEDVIQRAADSLRQITHDRDIALVIENHALLVERLGLDGVHLTDGSRSVHKMRRDLGEDAIVGTYCGTSRHDGMTAGDMGADYVSFGPVGQSLLGTGERATLDLFQWWSEMIEVPAVTEGGLDEELIRQLAPYSDFFGFGEEIWATEDPVATYQRLVAATRG